MTLFQTGSLYLLAVCLFLPTGSIRAQGSSDSPPDRIDLNAFPGQMIKEVVIPIPAEVFAVLDKVGDPDWESGILHVESDPKLMDRGILAMFFGSLVAEGFIAVQAESSEDIQKIGMRSLELAEALGLEKAVKQHSLTVVEAAKNGEWDVVRAELDKTQQTVRDTMNLQRDQELSGLVSLGGWLRGTNVLTRFIVENYSDNKAELLNQPDLVIHFSEMIAGLKGSLRDSREIIEIEKGLGQITLLFERKEGDNLDRNMVKQLHEITDAMLKQFYFLPGEG